jgi:alpha-1,2-mannosyltransferase
LRTLARRAVSDLRAFVRERPALFALLLTVFVLNVGYSAYRADHLRACDLVQGFLNPTRGIVFEGKDPLRDFRVNAYPQFFYVVMLPFALLSNPHASVWWSLLSTVLWVGIGYMVATLLTSQRGEAPRKALLFAPLGLTILFLNNLHLGQSNLVPLFFVVLAFYRLAQNKDAEAGLWLSFATAFKLTPALFCGYLVLRGRWKALGVFVAGVVLWMVLVPMAVLGPERSLRFNREWVGAVILPFAQGGQVQTRNISWYHTNQSLEAFLNRHFTPYGVERYGSVQSAVSLPIASEKQAHVAATVLRLILLLGLAFLWWSGRRDPSRAMVPDLALGLFAMLLLSPASWVSHYISAVVALAVVAHAYWSQGKATFERLGMTMAVASTFAVTVMSHALSLVFLGNLVLLAALVRTVTRERQPS